MRSWVEFSLYTFTEVGLRYNFLLPIKISRVVVGGLVYRCRVIVLSDFITAHS